MTVMRAKMQVQAVYQGYGDTEILKMYAVCGQFDQDGKSDDNTYARFSPSGNLELCVSNPDLRGKILAGQKYYIDFTLADVQPPVDNAHVKEGCEKFA